MAKKLTEARSMNYPAVTIGLTEFVRESNRIEGITREPTVDEVAASERFINLFQVSPATLGLFQSVVAPRKPLRNQSGMNVRVGSHVAPSGGPEIGRSLESLLARANSGDNPWKLHVDFETLHPYMDGNGRTGRILWAWQMRDLGRDPFALPFLHRFYYQTLENTPAGRAALAQHKGERSGQHRKSQLRCGHTDRPDEPL